MQEYAGTIALVCGIVLAVLIILVIFLLINLRSHVAVQKLTFLGFYATDFETRKPYAEFTIGNKSLNDVGISTLGARNGKVSFDLTELYRSKVGIASDVRIVIEQRSALTFRMEADELSKLILDGKEGKKVLGKLRLYAVDVTGRLFKGSIPTVRKLLIELTENPPVVIPVPASAPAPAPAETEEAEERA